MIAVNIAGWSKDLGAYNIDIPFDETREDYEVRFKDGSVSKQEGPFAEESHDWNNDGDIYPCYGAWFRGQDGRGEYLTPEIMVRLVMDSEAVVSGLDNPLASLKRQATASLRYSPR